MEIQGYNIFQQKTGQLVASLALDGSVYNCQEPASCAILRTLLQRDLVIREDLPGSGVESEEEDYDPFPDEQMCFFNLITLRPGDPHYLAAFVRRLPYLSNFEARPC